MFTKVREPSAEAPAGRLLQIDNVHVNDCGPPPAFDASDSYLSYYENRYGEQWVFVGDRATGKAKIYGGDCGWEQVYEITLDDPCPRVTLNQGEIAWIVACLLAMSRHHRYDDIIKAYNASADRRREELKKELGPPRKRESEA